MNPEMVLLFFFSLPCGSVLPWAAHLEICGVFFVATNTANFTLQRIQTGSESMQLSPP